MGCFDKPRIPAITTTRQASELDVLPGANRRRKRRRGQVAGEAQRDLGLSLGEGGLLGQSEERRSLFG